MQVKSTKAASLTVTSGMMIVREAWPGVRRPATWTKIISGATARPKVSQKQKQGSSVGLLKGKLKAETRIINGATARPKYLGMLSRMAFFMTFAPRSRFLRPEVITPYILDLNFLNSPGINGATARQNVSQMKSSKKIQD